MRMARPWLWMSLVLAACNRDAADEETDAVDSPEEDSEPTDGEDSDDPVDPADTDSADSDVVDTEDTDVADTDVDPPVPTLPQRLQTRRWKTVFVDEFDGFVGGNPCYDPIATPPQCVNELWESSACVGPDIAAIGGMNFCVWSVFDAFNTDDGSKTNNFDPEEVSVHDGGLWLDAHRVGTVASSDCGNPRSDGSYSKKCAIRSGAVVARPWSETSGYTQQYGRFEVRAKLPSTAGAWPMYGLMPDGGEWPVDGEIDILSALAGEPGVISGGLIGGKSTDGVVVVQETDGAHDLDDSRTYDDFHTYAVEWEPGEVRYFFDDLEFLRITEGSLVPGTILESPDAISEGGTVAPFGILVPDLPSYFALKTSIVPTGAFTVDGFDSLTHRIDAVRALVPCEAGDTDPQCQPRSSGSANITTSFGMTAHRWSPQRSAYLRGDFDGNGASDLLLRARSSGENTYLLQGDGRGEFAPLLTVSDCCWLNAATWSEEGRGAVVGDFNGDGRDDVVLQGAAAPDGSYVMFGSASGGFLNAVAVTNAGGMSYDRWAATRRTPYAGDFDGDGRDDLLLVAKTNSEDTILVLSDVSGSFRSSAVITNLGGLSAARWANSRVHIGDFDGNGTDDVVLQGNNTSDITTLLRGKDGSFVVSGVSYSYQMSPEFWASAARRGHIGDFNGDGRSDLLLQARSTSERTLLLLGSTTGFENVRNISYAAGMGISAWSEVKHELGVGDFDGDGASDLLLRPNAEGERTLMLRADRAGSFEASRDITTEQSLNAAHWSTTYRALHVADWDGDGRDDALLTGLTADDATYVIYLPGDGPT
jgi:hypothetical protein